MELASIGGKVPTGTQPVEVPVNVSQLGVVEYWDACGQVPADEGVKVSLREKVIAEIRSRGSSELPVEWQRAITGLQLGRSSAQTGCALVGSVYVSDFLDVIDSGLSFEEVVARYEGLPRVNGQTPLFLCLQRAVNRKGLVKFYQWCGVRWKEREGAEQLANLIRERLVDGLRNKRQTWPKDKPFVDMIEAYGLESQLFVEMRTAFEERELHSFVAQYGEAPTRLFVSKFWSPKEQRRYVKRMAKNLDILKEEFGRTIFADRVQQVADVIQRENPVETALSISALIQHGARELMVAEMNIEEEVLVIPDPVVRRGRFDTALRQLGVTLSDDRAMAMHALYVQDARAMLEMMFTCEECTEDFSVDDTQMREYYPPGEVTSKVGMNCENKSYPVVRDGTVISVDASKLLKLRELLNQVQDEDSESLAEVLKCAKELIDALPVPHNFPKYIEPTKAYYCMGVSKLEATWQLAAIGKQLTDIHLELSKISDTTMPERLAAVQQRVARLNNERASHLLTILEEEFSAAFYGASDKVPLRFALFATISVPGKPQEMRAIVQQLRSGELGGKEALEGKLTLAEMALAHAEFILPGEIS